LIKVMVITSISEAYEDFKKEEVREPKKRGYGDDSAKPSREREG